MKTAMQELLENLQKQFDEQTHPIRIDGTYFLEKEKEQMFEFANNYVDYVMGGTKYSAEEYYNDKYKQNKKPLKQKQMKTTMQEMIEWIEERFNNPKETEVYKKATELLEKEKEEIDLETYLRIKLDQKDAKQLYDIATDDVRGWIDWYNEAEIKNFAPTHHTFN